MTTNPVHSVPSANEAPLKTPLRPSSAAHKSAIPPPRDEVTLSANARKVVQAGNASGGGKK